MEAEERLTRCVRLNWLPWRGSYAYFQNSLHDRAVAAVAWSTDQGFRPPHEDDERDTFSSTHGAGDGGVALHSPARFHEHPGHTASCPLACDSLRKLVAASRVGRRADAQRSQELGLQEEADRTPLPTPCGPEQPLGPSAASAPVGPGESPRDPQRRCPVLAAVPWDSALLTVTHPTRG